MKQSQPYFIRPQNNTTQNKVTHKIASMICPNNHLTNLSHQTSNQAFPPNSPQIMKNQETFFHNKKVPCLNTPTIEISKQRILNDLSLYKLPTQRISKQENRRSSIMQMKKTPSQHINSIKLRSDRRKNFTPTQKMTTEPNEPRTNSVSKHDESQDILFRLQKKQIPMEKNERFQSIQKDQIISSIKLTQNHYIELEEDNKLLFETKQFKGSEPKINIDTKERILDLLCLSTQEIKLKFAENNKIGNSNIQIRQTNKLRIPRANKSRFPTDFFNVLSPNSHLR